jgi:hypothetical protein
MLASRLTPVAIRYGRMDAVLIPLQVAEVEGTPFDLHHVNELA